jgi:hypothetical protein
MNEHPNVADLATDEYERHQRATAQQAGVGAIERQFFPGETTELVEISLWVRGREIRTNTEYATVQRIMAILTGLAD